MTNGLSLRMVRRVGAFQPDMSIPNNRQLQRRPIHPGEILREDFMPDYDLSGSGLASAIGVSRHSVIHVAYLCGVNTSPVQHKV
jgi:hypothetical protein